MHYTQRQHKRLSCCLTNGVRVTASLLWGGLMGAQKQIMNHSTWNVFRESKTLPP